MYDLIVRNGKICDGTGSPPFFGDVAIKHQQIADIGNLKNEKAKKTIDATGAIVAPGFIDIQSHSDVYFTTFEYPHQESLLAQGISTINLGNCGASLAPLPSPEALKSIQKWRSLDGVNTNWQYFDEYLNAMDKLDLGVNVTSLVGHSTIRRGLIADMARAATDAEIKILERILVSSLKSGSYGLSFGLVYAHEYNSSRAELSEMARVVGKFNRLISFHLRNESNLILDSLDEVIKFGAEASVRLKISHLKIRGQRNWYLIDEVVKKIENAYQKGIKISFDVYPYTTSWSVLYTYLPKWSFEGGVLALQKRLSQPFLRRKILNEFIEQGSNFSEIIIATATSAPQLIGKSIQTIANNQGVSVYEAILNLLASVKSEIIVFEENISKDHLLTLLKHPLSLIASDSPGVDLDYGKTTHNLVHPRSFGTMPKFLETVRKENLMPIEKAINKITGYPAEVLGLFDRGVIKLGKQADLVVFDPQKIGSCASIKNPYIKPEGIQYLIVDGDLIIAEEKFTGQFSGSVLRA